MDRPNIIQALNDPDILGCLGMTGPSWNTAHVIMRAGYGLTLMPDEVELFRQTTGLEEYNPPKGGWGRVVIIAGRQSGKSRIGAAVAAYESIFPTAGGSNLRTVLVAQDQESLKGVLFAYVKEPFESGAPLESELSGNITATMIPLNTGVVIRAYPCSSKAVRGPRAQVVILDEWAFYRSSTGEALERKVDEATRFSLLTTNGKQWIISSPYDTESELHKLHEQYYGVPNDHTLIFQVPTEVMNPTISADTLAKLRAQDPDAAEAELDAKFRKGVSALFDMTNVQACVDTNRTERAPADDVSQYFAFVDCASGTKTDLDNYAVAIAHADRKTRKVIIDAVRYWKPPYDPKTVTKEVAAFVKTYRVNTVHGDKVALGFIGGEFRDSNITYTVTEGTEQTASSLILNLLPMVNARGVVLLDQPDVLSEFRTVKRVLRAGGLDRTDHPRGTHDDALVCISGAAYFAYKTISGSGYGGVTAITRDTMGNVYVNGQVQGERPRRAIYGDDPRGETLPEKLHQWNGRDCPCNQPVGCATPQTCWVWKSELRKGTA
jgi:hypothetical protein